MASRSALDTARDVRVAMEPYPEVPLTTACAMLGTRPLHQSHDATTLEPHERQRFDRLVALLHAATDRAGKGYVGLRWTTIRAEELGGQTAIEALKTDAGTTAVMTILERRQRELAEDLPDEGTAKPRGGSKESSDVG